MAGLISSKFPGDEVSHSTDWLSTPLESFVPVDAALRCQVCKEFYKTPMITSCSHTFCSLCIRRCLANDGKCPACRAPEQEMKLRNNWVLEEIVDAFTRARPDALEYAHRSPIAPKSRSPKRKAADAVLQDEQPPTKRTRSSSRKTLATAVETNRFNDAVDVEDVEDNRPEQNDGLVECPICQARMKIDRIDPHIDNGCPPTEPPRNTGSVQTRSLPISQPRTQKLNPLPALSYSLLKDNALRKKLSDQGLSTAGNRQWMERRYSEWVTLWNANCDSSKPRPRRDLLRDLETWERTLGSHMSSSSNITNLGTTIRSKDFDVAEWQATNKDNFKDLIAKAKAQREPPNSPAKNSIIPLVETERSPSSPTPTFSYRDPGAGLDSGAESRYLEASRGLPEAQVGDTSNNRSTNRPSQSAYSNTHLPHSSQLTSQSMDLLSSQQSRAPSLASQDMTFKDSSDPFVDGGNEIARPTQTSLAQ